MSFPGPRWYVATVRYPQIVRDQKKFRNHWSKVRAEEANKIKTKMNK